MTPLSRFAERCSRLAHRVVCLSVGHGPPFFDGERRGVPGLFCWHCHAFKALSQLSERSGGHE